MEELNLESSLSIEEIERNFQDVDFFSGIMEGLQEALAVKKGEAAEDTLIRKRSLPNVDTTAVRLTLV